MKVGNSRRHRRPKRKDCRLEKGNGMRFNRGEARSVEKESESSALVYIDGLNLRYVSSSRNTSFVQVLAIRDDDSRCKSAAKREALGGSQVARGGMRRSVNRRHADEYSTRFIPLGPARGRRREQGGGKDGL